MTSKTKPTNAPGTKLGGMLANIGMPSENQNAATTELRDALTEMADELGEHE